MTFDQNGIEALNQTIQSVGGQWTAGETTLTRLPSAEVDLWLGYVPEPGDPTAEERESQAQTLHQQWLGQQDTMKVAQYPKAIDWRSVKGYNYISPVKVQGSCGSCVVFAVAAMIDARLRAVLDVAVNYVTGSHIQDLSEGQLAFCAGRENICRTGWRPEGALQYCVDTGLAPEA